MQASHFHATVEDCDTDDEMNVKAVLPVASSSAPLPGSEEMSATSGFQSKASEYFKPFLHPNHRPSAPPNGGTTIYNLWTGFGLHWDRLLAGVQPFPAQSSKLQEYIDTLRTGQGSVDGDLRKTLLQLTDWSNACTDAYENKHRSAQTDDMHMCFTEASDGALNLVVSVAQKGVHLEALDLAHTAHERFYFFWTPSKDGEVHNVATQLFLLSSGRGKWTFKADLHHPPCVYGWDTRSGAEYSGGFSALTGQFEIEPQDLQPLFGLPFLSAFNPNPAAPSPEAQDEWEVIP